MTITDARPMGGNGDARSLADAALRLASFAPVLPIWWADKGRCACGRANCDSPAKHPIISGGVHSASQDPATVRDWLLRWPRANTGLAMGARCWALDVDGQEGLDTLADLEDAHRWLPETVASVTGSGGMHLLFAADDRVRKNTVRQLGPGLDVRTRGGYIVAPPSVHKSGSAYYWLPGRDPWSVELSPAPAWLLDLVDPLRPATRQSVISKPPVRAAGAARSRYIRKALENEMESVARAGPGGRNAALFKAASSLRRFLETGELQAREIGPALVAAAEAAGLPRHEAERTAESGLKVRGAV